MVKNTKTYPSADCGSDHNPLISFMNLKFKRVIRKCLQPKLNTDLLRFPNTIMQLKETLENNIDLITLSNNSDTEDQWKEHKGLIIETSKNLLGMKKREVRRSWMTEEILDLMKERRKYKNKSTYYKRIHKEIQAKIVEAKERWLIEKCKEIEHLQKIHACRELHKKLNELTFNKRNFSMCIEKTRWKTDNRQRGGNCGMGKIYL